MSLVQESSVGVHDGTEGAADLLVDLLQLWREYFLARQ